MGETLAFISTKPLTGFNSDDPTTGEPHVEVFAYEAESGSIVCVSCGRLGGSTRYDSTLPSASLAGNGTTFYNGTEPGFITADGSRFFFESRERLAPGMTGTGNKVYQYTVGDDGGTITPISGGDGPASPAGHDQGEDKFAGATPDGSDVFLRTKQPLLPTDQDQLADIYDARVDGGLASEPTELAECQGDSCQGSRGRTEEGDPGSASLRGSGNVRRGRTPTITIRRGKAQGGTAAVILVGVPGGGSLTVSGSMIRRLTKAVPRAGQYKLRLVPAPASRTRVERGKTVRAQVRVTFKPRQGPLINKKFGLTFTPPPSKASSAASNRKGA